MTIKKNIEIQKKFFNSHVTLDINYRKEQLKKLRKILVCDEDLIYQAMYRDMKKPYFEAYSGEINFVIKQIDFMLKRLNQFNRPRKINTSLVSFPAKSLIQPEPYGVVLIISPFNYPVYLSLVPLVGAMAAGNTIVLKPSGRSSACSGILAKLLNQYFEPEYLNVIERKNPGSEDIMDQKFDYIFFTGSEETGKKLMAKAAKNLVPLTLELGGKNPCIFDRNIDFPSAVRSLVWGKFFNAGQTCIAPDYLLVPRENAQEVYSLIPRYIKEFYGKEPKESPDFARIIDGDHLNELVSLLDEEKILCGGEFDLEDNYLAPTVMKSVTWKHKSMTSEIFGPILPVVSYNDLDKLREELSRRPSPLSFYLFSKNKNLIQSFIKTTRAGSVIVNDFLVQGVSNELPFGGIGASGMGKSHGWYSFQCFSHFKSIIHSRHIPWFAFLRFPPYKMTKKIIRFLFKWGV